jgi:ankyrin repeat protein
VRIRIAALGVVVGVTLLGTSSFAADAVTDAVTRGDHQAVRALVAKKADVNLSSADGTTALMVAAERGDQEAVTLLLGAGANPRAANRYGVTPLALAATKGDAATIQALVKAGADPKAANGDGETALMSAARSGNVAAVKMLIALGADPNAKEGWLEQTALMWAAAGNSAPVVQALVESGAQVNVRSKTLPGQQPRPKGQQDTAFQSAHSNFPRGGFTPLIFAAQYNAIDGAKALLDHGADINLADPDGITPLMMAILNGNYDFANVLVQRGADVTKADRSGRTALYFATDMHTLEWLFSRPTPQPTGELDSPDIVKVLLDHKANPNVRTTARGFLLHHDSPGNSLLIAGSTPFMKAATTSDLKLMKLLLEYGANPNITTANHTTPLMAAAGLGWTDISSLGGEDAAIEAIKLCLEHGADINAFNDLGETALHGAAQRGADKIVRFLASQGATLEAKNRRGRTPLDDAIGQARDEGEDVRRPERKSTEVVLRELIAAQKQR